MNISLKEHIRSIKPAISEGTLKTYTSLLSSFFKRRFGKDANLEESLEFSKNTGDALSFFNVAYEDKPLATKKTVLAALYAIEPSPMYHAEMVNYSNENNKEIRKQEKSEKQEENWIPYPQVLEIVERYRKGTLSLFRSKVPLQGDDLMRAQQYVILALTTGVFIPPRRSSDWTEMNLNNPTESSNYIKKGQFHFVTYKTAKTYGEQTVDIPTKLKTLLGKWKRLNGTDYMLVNMDRSRMLVPRLTLEMNRIFDRNISTSMLRHIYLSHRLGYIPKLDELDKLAENMGHSNKMQLEYIKY